MNKTTKKTAKKITKKTVRKIASPAKKNKKSRQDDVFGLITHAEGIQTELVILKSKAIANCIKDGMSEEEAEEFWDYNIAGSYGSSSYSCVDDTISSEEIIDLLDNDDTIVNPPYTGRPHIAQTNLIMKSIEDIVNSEMRSKEKIKALKEILENNKK